MHVRIARRIAGLLLSPLLIAASVAVPARAGEGSFQVAQVMVRSRVVIRVTSVDVAARVAWKEKKGPRCLAMAAIQGAGVIAPSSVDFILTGGQRVRARFASSCPGLAYYSGFYVAPNADGQMCAGRDSVRDRAGGECEIARLRTLVPK